jgi:hypothetical protein
MTRVLLPIMTIGSRLFDGGRVHERRDVAYGALLAALRLVLRARMRYNSALLHQRALRWIPNLNRELRHALWRENCAGLMIDAHNNRNTAVDTRQTSKF